MKVTYVGPFEEVEVPSLGVVAVRGVPVEVPDAAAKELLTQRDNWTPAKPATKKEN